MKHTNNKQKNKHKVMRLVDKDPPAVFDGTAMAKQVVVYDRRDLPLLPHPTHLGAIGCESSGLAK